MKLKKILRIFIIWATFVLISCGFQGNSIPPVHTTTPLVVTLTATEKPIKIPTVIPIPTLSEQNAIETFTSQIEGNNECNLPCWLGVIPGQTDFDDVENIFLQYNAIAYTKISSEWISMKVFFPNFETAIQAMITDIYPSSDGKVLRAWVYAGVNPKGLVGYPTNDYPEYQQLWQKYFVSGIFKEHGQPEIILLDTTLMQADPSTTFPFSLWIIYPHEGFLLRYDGINNKVEENIRICPMLSNIQIETWDIKKLSYQELIKNERVGGISIGPQPIESVTDFDIESFYNLFKDGNIDTCFDTPSSLWPPN